MLIIACFLLPEHYIVSCFFLTIKGRGANKKECPSKLLNNIIHNGEPDNFSKPKPFQEMGIQVEGDEESLLYVVSEFPDGTRL